MAVAPVQRDAFGKPTHGTHVSVIQHGEDAVLNILDADIQVLGENGSLLVVCDGYAYAEMVEGGQGAVDRGRYHPLGMRGQAMVERHVPVLGILFGTRREEETHVASHGGTEGDGEGII